MYLPLNMTVFVQITTVFAVNPTVFATNYHCICPKYQCISPPNTTVSAPNPTVFSPKYHCICPKFQHLPYLPQNNTLFVQNISLFCGATSRTKPQVVPLVMLISKQFLCFNFDRF